MVEKPRRIAALIEDIEHGRSPDWERVGRLLDLDTVQIGEDFARESLARQEAADAQLIGR